MSYMPLELPTSMTDQQRMLLDWTDGRLHRTERAKLSAEASNCLEDLAFRFGDSADSYLATEPHGECLFWNLGEAAASCEVDGRYWHIPGGLLAPPELKPTLCQELYNTGKENRIHVTIYSVPQTDVEMYQQQGYQVTKFAEEPILDLRELTWQGKAYEWVRRQTNYCQRQGLIATEVVVEPRLFSSQLLPTWNPDETEWEHIKQTLHEIQHEDLADRAFDKPLRFFEGQLFLEHLNRRRVFVAHQQDSKHIDAYCIINPMQQGKAWAIEMYRKRDTAPRGAIPFLMRQIIDELKAEGVEEVSLCMVPGRGVGKPLKGDSWMARWALNRWYHWSVGGFNVAGQDYFKSRFRPTYRSRYMAMTEPAHLLSAWSFLRVAGALDVSPWKVLTHTLRRSKTTD